MEEKMQRNQKFILSIAAGNIDITIINIEEMSGYVAQNGRSASVITEKKTYGELSKMNHQLVMNYTKPAARVILNDKKKPYLNVYSYVLEHHNSGLIIAETDTLSDDISDLICKSDFIKTNDIDIMLCRDSFSSVTRAEIARADYIRISADPDLDASIFTTMSDLLKEKTATLMISQLFVNEQLATIKDYVQKNNKSFEGKGFTDYVNYAELNKQLAYFVYVDMRNNKILNLSKETVAGFLREMIKMGISLVPEHNVDIVAEMITL